MVMRAYSPGKRRWVAGPAWLDGHDTGAGRKCAACLLRAQLALIAFFVHMWALVCPHARHDGAEWIKCSYMYGARSPHDRGNAKVLFAPPPLAASHRIVTAECMSGCVCVNGACILSRWLHRGARLTHGQCWSGLRKTSRSANGGYPNGLSQTLVRFIGRIYELCVWVCRIVWDIVSMFLRRHRVITELCEENIVRINLFSLFFHSLHWGIREWGYIIRGCMHYTV